MSLLAKGEMLVEGLSSGQDVATSLRLFRHLGGKAIDERGGIRLFGLERALNPQKEDLELDCANSGTTMRLLAGILAGTPGTYKLIGDEQLSRRPMERVADPLRQMGAKIATQLGRPPVIITGGNLNPIDYQLKDASAQVKGAILLAGLLANGGPTRVTEIANTRNHTELLINYFGGKVTKEGLTLTVWPEPLTLTENFLTPGDPSSAAFFLTGAALIPGSKVTAKDLLQSPARTGFLRVLHRMGAQVSLTMTSDTPEPMGDVTVAYNGPLTATEIPAEEVPSLIDEIPILAFAATQAQGLTIFRQVDELRIKETDRLMSIRHQLGALGARVKVEGDDLYIEGPTSFMIPKELDSGSDHRLAMTLAIALLAAKAKIPILGEESIGISYPDFKAQLSGLWVD
jgi:3-phosphoshikimate 1-carboxyvinyltransferase